jgi:hypothetical protein
MRNRTSVKHFFTGTNSANIVKLGSNVPYSTDWLKIVRDGLMASSEQDWTCRDKLLVTIIECIAKKYDSRSFHGNKSYKT